MIIYSNTMKRIILPLLIAALPILVFGKAKITRDEIDEFTGLRVVETSTEFIDAYSLTSMGISFRLENNIKWIDVKYAGGRVSFVSEGNPLLFKSTTDNIVQFDAATGSTADVHGTLEVSYMGNVEWFATNHPRLTRTHGGNRYSDRRISQADGAKICQLYDIFARTIEAPVGTIVYGDYDISFYNRKIGAPTWDLIKSERYEYMSPEATQKIVDEWRNQTSDEYEYDCKIKKLKD